MTQGHDTTWYCHFSKDMWQSVQSISGSWCSSPVGGMVLRPGWVPSDMQSQERHTLHDILNFLSQWQKSHRHWNHDFSDSFIAEQLCQLLKLHIHDWALCLCSASQEHHTVLSSLQAVMLLFTAIALKYFAMHALILLDSVAVLNIHLIFLVACLKPVMPTLLSNQKPSRTK